MLPQTESDALRGPTALRDGASKGAAGRATHSRRWLDYFSPAKPLLGPRKNQAISVNAESFGLQPPYGPFYEIVY